jgi:alpha-amylase
MNYKASNKSKQYLNLYFQVHQPRRLRRFQFFDIGSGISYFDDSLNENILQRIARDCYIPANELLLKLIHKYPSVRITFSISGMALEQFQEYAPAVLDSFRTLAATGKVEFLGETYYHSLSFLTDKNEFIAQVGKHKQKIEELIGVSPSVFRNTELIYSDTIGSMMYDLGFKGIYLDGIEGILKGRSPNKVYTHLDKDLMLFPRNYALSDDIAFRYSDPNWNQWPLTPGKFVNWLQQIPAEQNYIGLGMDYETFGEHQKASGGIFKFLEQVISILANLRQFGFINPSEVVKRESAEDILSTSKIISWADQARDLSAWLGNDLQRDAFDSLNKLHHDIIDTNNADLIDDYRHLQTSDHFYYMSTKKSDDGNVHQYFSPYSSPYEAFMNYMNVVADLEWRVKKEIEKQALKFKTQQMESLVTMGINNPSLIGSS